MTKAKHFILYLMAVMLAVGIASCNKETDEGKKEPNKVNPSIEETDDVHVFEQVVSVEESKIVNVFCDTINHHYSIEYKGEVPEIKPGNVVVVREGNESRIILVTKSQTSGQIVDMEGPLGDLSYVFYNTEFTISTNPDLLDSVGATVFCPESSVSLSKKGKDESSLSILDLKYSKSKTWTLGGDNFLVESKKHVPIGNQPSLFNPGDIPVEDGIKNNVSGSLKVEFGIDVDGNLNTYDFKFTEPVEHWYDKVLFLCSKKFTIDIRGSLSLNLTAKTELAVKEKLSWKNTRMKLFECPELPFGVPVGPVIIPGGFKVPIYWDVDLSLSGELSLQLPIGLTGTLNYGFSYDSDADGWNSEEPKFDSKFEFKPSLVAKANAAVKFTVYPEFNIFIYMEKLGMPAVAPKFDLTGEYAVGASAGVDFDIKNMSSKGKAGVGSDFTGSYGFDVATGWILPFTSKYKTIKDFKIKDKNKFYESPTALKVKSINGSNIEEIFDSKGGFLDYNVQKGVPVAIDYTAMSEFNLFVHRDWESFMPHIYETGQLPENCELKFGCGDQSISWVPESDIAYFDLVVANSSGKEKGKVRIARKPKLTFKYVDANGTQIYNPFKKNDVVKLEISSDIPVDFDIAIGESKKEESNTNSVVIPLETSKALDCDVVIKAKASSGFSADDITFKYRIENADGTLDKVDDPTTPETPDVPETPVVNPVTLNYDLSKSSVEQNEELTLSGSASQTCIYEISVGDWGESLPLGSTFSVKLPTSVAGTHNGKIVAKTNGEVVAEKIFTYEVKESAKPVIPSGNAVTFTETVNGVSFTMVAVDGGTFLMGGTEEQGGDIESVEFPVHQVTLSGYSIGQTEVTQALWVAVMGSNPSYFKGDDLPVEQVSWNDIQEFLQKLNQMTGRNYRLPTEAEWEYAARGGNKSQGYKYSGSNNIGEVAWYNGNSGWVPHTVGTKSPNELGIYDMSGNVREWCQDWYGYYSSSSQSNPTGPATGSFRVVRGGSWDYYAGDSRVSDRNCGTPDPGTPYHGFRLALSSDGAPSVPNVTFDLPKLSVEQNEELAVTVTASEPCGFILSGEGMGSGTRNNLTSHSFSLPTSVVGTHSFTVEARINGVVVAEKVITYEVKPVIPSGNTFTETVNGVSFKMIAVEGGTFQMGGTEEQGNEANSDEFPVHQVTLSGYSIGQTEVTQALWIAVMGSNPSEFKGDDLPVEYVSWNDVQEFLQKLNQMTGKNYRLPTEAEWEYAARGGNKSQGYKYSGSNNIGDVAWYDGNSGWGTHIVGTKSPNELGIYDMSGNVYEWCQDWYGDYSSSSQSNPTGPATRFNRVRRGGSWYYYARNCRVSDRNGWDPYGNGDCEMGFRLAL